MRTLLLRSLAVAWLCLPAFTVHAQDVRPAKSVQFKGGLMLVFRDAGQGEVLTNELSMTERIKVATNGTFTVGSGKVRKFTEGQKLGADGNLTSPDGTVYPVEDHIIMKDGRLMLVRDGDSTKATRELVLGDGSRVRPDGTIHTPDGRLHRMLDGQISMFTGESIPSTDSVTVKDGMVILQKDGGRVTLKRGQTIMMSDGSKVFSDGTVLRPNGTKTKVGEGEIYKLPGVLPAKD